MNQQQAAAAMQQRMMQQPPAAMQEPVDNNNRTLAYLQAVVEEKKIPFTTASERDSTAENIFMMQGMEHTDERAVILLTVPHSRCNAEEDGDGGRTGQAPGEGYQIARLIDASLTAGEEPEESKEAATGLDDDDDLTGIQMLGTSGPSQITNSVESPDTKLLVEEWSPEQEVDPNMPHQHRNLHVKTVVLNNRFYIFQNLSPTNQLAIKVVDPCLRRIFQIPLLGNGNKIKDARINYSISHMQNKVYLYGGLNDRNEVLENMEMFDAMSYKMSEVKYRLEQRVAGRQGHAAIAIDKYNMFVIGGTQETGLVDPEQMPADQAVCKFDLDAQTWHPKSASLGEGSEPLPWNLVYHSLFKVDTHNIGVLWYDSFTHSQTIGEANAAAALSKEKSAENAGDQKSNAAAQNKLSRVQRILRTSIYNLVRNTWRTIRLCHESAIHQPSFRFGATLVPIFNKHVVMREQMEQVKKIAPRNNGPVPLERLLVFGGITLDDTYDLESQQDPAPFSGTQTTRQAYVPCTVLHFTNSNPTPLTAAQQQKQLNKDPSSEESKMMRPRKKRK